MTDTKENRALEALERIEDFIAEERAGLNTKDFDVIRQALQSQAEKDRVIEVCQDYVMRTVSGMAAGSSFTKMQEALSEYEKIKEK